VLGIDIDSGHREKPQMKLKIPASDFADLISRAHLFSAYDASHPAFSSTLLEVTKSGSLRVSVANQISGCRMSASAEGEQGKVCIPSQQLDRLVQSLPKEGSFRLDIVEKGGTGRARASAGKAFSAILPIRPAEDFVKMDDPPKDGWFEVEVKDLIRTITAVEWAAGSDYDTHPVLTGIHLCSEYSEATDGHCMARLTPGIVPEGKPAMVVPSVMLKQMKQMTAREEGKIRIASSNNIWIRGFGWAVYCQPVADKFMDISKFMYSVDDGEAEVMGGRKVPVNWIHMVSPQLRDAVRRSMTASGGNLVRFQFKNDAMTMTSVPDEGDAGSSLRVSQKLDFSADDALPGRFDELAAFGYNPTYLQKALGPFSEETLRMLWSPRESLQLHDDGGMQAAVMPARLPGS
jgi:DNA polymerase III sliding clamp (beta) subunit (PCNA family)